MTALHPRPRTAGPVLALLVNAFTWGVSWWPFRQLQAMGLHPLWATTIIYVLSALAILAWRPAALRQFVGHPALWLIFLGSGATNATFNWSVSIGDVVRVVLLFYLMPLWSLLLARVILQERLTTSALVRVAMALAGAGLVLSQGGVAEGGGAPRAGLLPDVLALLGGFAFALNNVMLKRESAQPEEGRALAMFLGGTIVAGATATALSAAGAAGVQWPVATVHWVLPALGLALVFMASNLCLQYGAARLSAAATAVVMPCEVLFAALTSVWWGGATLHASVLAGGALILAATLASVLEKR
ncbi:MAG TPA: DMT family transporter [Burkholderiaceae bacterium]|jgi:drug/metabolite transporter (DMT)-like permease|nr:DMT family transporter [Burkholderiaceae bacterium]